MKSEWALNWTSRKFKLNINEKVSLFLNKTIFNIVSNFILYETLITGDWDPPWINIQTKNLISIKKRLYKNIFL